MGPMAAPARMVRRIGRNFAYNLGYIPADKLGWKPAPTAKSALEIVNHTAYFLTGMAGVAGGEGWSDPQFTPATDAESAKALITQCAERYAAALEGVAAADLDKQIELPFGKFSLELVATMAAVDTIHHHGQIAYIQTLLGDSEDHFDPKIMGG